MSAARDVRPAHPLRSWLGVAVVVLLSILGVAGVQSYRDLASMRDREADLHARIDATRERIERLDQRLESLEDDRFTLERLAREELGMVYPGDVVIVLPGPDER